MRHCERSEAMEQGRFLVIVRVGLESRVGLTKAKVEIILGKPTQIVKRQAGAGKRSSSVGTTSAVVVGPPTSLLRIVDSLQQRGADIIIAGCTEVEMHLSPFLSDNPQIVFPLRLVASTLADLFHRTSSNNAVSPVRRCPS
jgi:hypothetical protein